MKAIKIGITGGIGSGKSVISRLLRMMDVPIYDSDTEAKRLMQTDAGIRAELTALIKGELYTGHTLNKALLASYMFEDAQRVAQVNAIVHPRVKSDFRQWTNNIESSAPIVGIESAILLEAGFREEVDVVVLVYAPEDIRIRRAIHRDAASSESIIKRIRNQMSDETKREQADYVIVNDGKTPLIPQVLAMISSLSKNIAYLCGH